MELTHFSLSLRALAASISPTHELFNGSQALAARGSGPWIQSWTGKARKKLAGFCAHVIVVSRKKIQFLVGQLRQPMGRPGERRKKNHRLAAFHPFTTLRGFHTISPFLWDSHSWLAEWKTQLSMVTRAFNAVAVLLLSFAVVTAARAQQPSPPGERNSDLPAAPQPADATSAPQEKSTGTEKPATPPAAAEHRFWDRENDWLFAAVGAGRALDYSSTLNLRRRHINEALLTNSIVDNHPLFAGIEVAGTAASIGVSYIFHRTGHHRLERWTSAVHAGIAIGGAIRNYCLPTPHPK